MLVVVLERVHSITDPHVWEAWLSAKARMARWLKLTFYGASRGRSPPQLLERKTGLARRESPNQDS
jgi:hypothetical protein